MVGKDEALLSPAMVQRIYSVAVNDGDLHLKRLSNPSQLTGETGTLVLEYRSAICRPSQCFRGTLHARRLFLPAIAFKTRQVCV